MTNKEFNMKTFHYLINYTAMKIDEHTKAAITVAQNDYFLVATQSRNEVQGLLVGTAVKKSGEVECMPSKYWDGSYWTVMVETPNGESRRMCCDVLMPTKKAKSYFNLQQKAYSTVLGGKKKSGKKKS